jgi:hypothetical protein
MAPLPCSEGAGDAGFEAVDSLAQLADLVAGVAAGDAGLGRFAVEGSAGEAEAVGVDADLLPGLGVEADGGLMQLGHLQPRVRLCPCAGFGRAADCS